MASFHFSNYPCDWLAIMVYGHFERWTAGPFERRRVISKNQLRWTIHFENARLSLYRG